MTMRNQAICNEVTSQAINWLKNTMEAQQQINISDFQRLTDWIMKLNEEIQLAQTSIEESSLKSEELPSLRSNLSRITFFFKEGVFSPPFYSDYIT